MYQAYSRQSYWPVMSVQPSVDMRQAILSFLTPHHIQVSPFSQYPAVKLLLRMPDPSTVQPKPSLIPVVEVREIDSLLRLQSGEIAFRGLMEAGTNGQQSCRWSRLAVLGQLFTASADGTRSSSGHPLRRVLLMTPTPGCGWTTAVPGIYRRSLALGGNKKFRCPRHICIFRSGPTLGRTERGAIKKS